MLQRLAAQDFGCSAAIAGLGAAPGADGVSGAEVR